MFSFVILIGDIMQHCKTVLNSVRLLSGKSAAVTNLVVHC